MPRSIDPSTRNLRARLGTQIPYLQEESGAFHSGAFWPEGLAFRRDTGSPAGIGEEVPEPCAEQARLFPADKH